MLLKEENQGIDYFPSVIDGFWRIERDGRLRDLEKNRLTVINKHDPEILNYIDNIEDSQQTPKDVRDSLSGDYVYQSRDVHVNDAGVMGKLCFPEDSNDTRLVILSQGLSANKDCPFNKWMEVILHSRGISTLSFDYYRDCAPGDVGIVQRASDLEKLVRQYKKLGYRVGGYGSSFGGLAWYLACANLRGSGYELDVIANRTIISKLNEALSRDLIQKTNKNKYNLLYIKNHLEEVVAMLNLGGLQVDVAEMRDVCLGKYNADKVASYVNCPNLNVQGSDDEKADMQQVRNTMSLIGKNNKKSHFVELDGSKHACRDILEHYKIQLYLVSMFLIENLEKKK